MFREHNVMCSREKEEENKAFNTHFMRIDKYVIGVQNQRNEQWHRPCVPTKISTLFT